MSGAVPKTVEQVYQDVVRVIAALRLVGGTHTAEAHAWSERMVQQRARHRSVAVRGQEAGAELDRLQALCASAEAWVNQRQPLALSRVRLPDYVTAPATEAQEATQAYERRRALVTRLTQALEDLLALIKQVLRAEAPRPAPEFQDHVNAIRQADKLTARVRSRLGAPLPGATLTGLTRDLGQMLEQMLRLVDAYDASHVANAFRTPRGAAVYQEAVGAWEAASGQPYYRR